MCVNVAQVVDENLLTSGDVLLSSNIDIAREVEIGSDTGNEVNLKVKVKQVMTTSQLTQRMP